jgi:hypothetical protein
MTEPTGEEPTDRSERLANLTDAERFYLIARRSQAIMQEVLDDLEEDGLLQTVDDGNYPNSSLALSRLAIANESLTEIIDDCGDRYGHVENLETQDPHTTD